MPVSSKKRKEIEDSIEAAEKELEIIATGSKSLDASRVESEANKLKVEQLVTQRVLDRAENLLNKLFDLAEGVSIEHKRLNKINSDGEEEYIVNVYQKEPDLKAIQYLFDRVLGKPAIVQQSTGSEADVGKGVKAVGDIIRNLAKVKAANSDKNRKKIDASTEENNEEE